MDLPSARILEKLIAFDTTSYKSNLQLIDYVSQWLDEHNVHSERVYDQSARKANLYATIGPADRGGVMLSGHTDVVPVDGQNWSSDPFVLREKDGCFFGRGSADMKGFIASMLAAVPAMCSAQLRTPIHLALSYDEEVGCLGVRRLIDMLSTLPTRPALAIIGEPTGMQPVIGHKGKTAFTVRLQGKAGHSAYTSDAVNAIEYAARLIAFINDLHRQREQQGPYDRGYRVAHSTLHVGTISGGSALNIVPQECEFAFEIRNIPQDDPALLTAQIEHEAARLQTRMRRTAPAASITITRNTSYPGLHTDPGHPAVAFVQRLLQCESTVEPGKVSFGTEGGLFSDSLGTPAVVCGPGNIAQAHKPDEFLHAGQLRLCDTLMQRLISRCREDLDF